MAIAPSPVSLIVIVVFDHDDVHDVVRGAAPRV
jgi:hypothetical protein